MASLNKLFSPFSHLNTLVRVPFRSHVGYMPFEGPIVPRNTPSHLLNREVLNVNLKPVTRIHFKWDPFHPKVKSVRDLMFLMSAERIRATNPKCTFKTEAVNDRAEATLRVALEDGRNLVFKLGHLNALDVISILNKHVLPMVKIEKETVLESKGSKMASAGKKKR